MRCNRCRKRVDSKAIVCGHCGESLFEQKRKNNITQIVVLVICVFIAICLNRIAFSTTSINQPTENKSTTTNPTDSLDDNVRLIRQDGEYKKYELKIDNFYGLGRYDFKVENHIVTIDFVIDGEFDSTDINKYVDGTFIFSDYSELVEEINRTKEPETYLANVHIFGDYVLLDADAPSSYKDGKLYLYDNKTELIKDFKELDSKGIVLADYSDEKAFDSTGITLKGDISAFLGPKVDLPGELFDISLCNKSEWPEWFDENYIYSATYKFEFEDGVLDLEGKMIESRTVEEVIKEDEEMGFCQFE